MKSFHYLVAAFLIVPLQIISAQTSVSGNFKLDDMEFVKKASSGLHTDTIWILHDDTTGRMYYDYDACDTLRAFDSACLGGPNGIWLDPQYCTIPQEFCNEAHCDTGDMHDSTYINFDFHTRNGYAGIKIDWDNGTSTWDVTGFDSLILWHKGPLPGQRVTVNFGSSPSCGMATVFARIGTFQASTVWKREAIALPDSMQRQGNYEMQVLINNWTPKLASPSNNTVGKGDSAVLSWNIVDTQATYNLQVSKDINFSKIVFNQTGITDTSTMAKGFEKGFDFEKDETYYWRVNAQFADGPSDWSEAGSFTTSQGEKKNCGCGAGTGMALIPPILIKVVSLRRRKKPSKRAG